MRIRTGFPTLVKLLIAVAATGCTTPMMRPPSVSPEAVHAEQVKQQQLLIQSVLLESQRLEDVGHPLLVAATGFCERYVTVRSGFTLANAHTFGSPLELAARSVGFSDTMVLSVVARGSAAERAGLRPGDRIVALQGRPAPLGRNAPPAAATELAAMTRNGALSMTVVAGPPPSFEEAATHPAPGTAPPNAAPRNVTLQGDRACPFGLQIAPDDAVNAFADGRNVIVNSGLMRFAANDDDLATVLAHEIAHNALRHIEAQKNNATLGGLFGAILDVAAATQGINTRGQFTKTGMETGALVFSQEFELEADYVGLYMLARAGRSIATAPRFWRQMAIRNPQSITYAGTHPTTAERFVRLEAAVGEVGQKLARGEIPSPELRNQPPLPTQVAATAIRDADRAAMRSGDPALATPPPPGAKPAVRGSPANVAPPAARVAERSPAPSAATSPALARARPAPLNAIPGDTTADRFVWTYGPPVPKNGMTLAQVKARARKAWIDGAEAREVGWLDRARAKFFEATQLDGSDATYHAALGGVLLRQGFLVEAEAVLSAAVLLEPNSQEYRLLLAEARVQRLRLEVKKP